MASFVRGAAFWLGVTACATELPSHLLVRALHAAEAGDPAAWGLCEQLEVGQGRGLCKVAAAKTQADPGAACTSITRAYWRGECWFELAEAHGSAGRWDPAIAACEHAEGFDRDCARHLWWISRSAGGSDGALRQRLSATFPGIDPELAEVDDDFGRLAADLRPPSEPDDAARFVARWERALDRDPGALGELCSGDDARARGRQAGDDPGLRRALATLRAERCEAGTDPH